MDAVATIAISLAATAGVYLATRYLRRPGPRTSQPLTDEEREVVRQFEQQAVDITCTILDAASSQLRRACQDAGLCDGGDQANHEMRSEAQRLVDSWEQASDDDNEVLVFQRTQTIGRWPILSLFASDGPAGLRAWLGSADAAERTVGAVDVEVDHFNSLASRLKQHPHEIWSSITILVLAMVRLEPDSEEDRVIKRYLSTAARTDEVTTMVEPVLDRALWMLSTIPAAQRRPVKDLLTIPLEERPFAIRLSRYLIQRTETRGVIDRAAGIAQGDFSLLWLAVALLRDLDTDDAIVAFCRTRRLVDEALGGGEGERTIQTSLVKHLPERSAENLAQMIVKIRQGIAPQLLLWDAPEAPNHADDAP